MQWPWQGNDRELDEELAAHVDMATEDYRRRGLPADEARRRALIDFGGVQQAKEGYREAGGFARLDALAQDLRYALRSLRRDRAFALMAASILTIGISANTAVFSIVNSVLLRPLAYGHAGQLVALEESIPQLSYLAPVLPVNGRHFLEWRHHARVLEDVALLDDVEINLTGAGDPERVNGSRVTPNLFTVLGVRPQLGSAFLPEHVREKVTVISDSLWRRRFGGSPALVGRTISLDGVPYAVVGVLPADFRDPFAGKVDVYTPWDVRGDDWGWAGDHNYFSVGRLRQGVTRQQAIAELNVLQARIASRFEGTGKLDLLIRVTPLQEHVVTKSRPALLTLMAAVGVVLLIACLNLGNLMLARSAARSREMAVRAALGAPLSRIMRGTFLEGLALSVGGAICGILLTEALLRSFRLWAPFGLARADELTLDGWAVLFAVGLSVVTAIIFAGMPALRLRRVDAQAALRASGRSMNEGLERRHFREILVAAEVGLSVALLISAGLLIHSSLRLEAVDRGFDATNVLTAEISLPNLRYSDAEARRRFFNAALNELQQHREISAAGVVSKLPLRGQAWSDVVTAEGDNRPIAERPIISYRPATPGYFRAMAISLLQGRTMAESDHPRLAAVMSQRAAERVWPGQNAIGKRFRRSDPRGPIFEVVGIAGDVRSDGLDRAPEPMVYVPLWARVPSTASFAVRTAGDPSAAVALLRRAVSSVDSQLALADVHTMSAIERRSTAYRRFLSHLVMAFAVVALLIAALGTYSVLAWSTGRRKAEIGIRMALGAEASEVRAMVLRQGLRPVASGLLAGLAAAMAAGQVLSSLLFEVSARDVLTYLSVVAVTLGAASFACWLPAYRASRVEPLEALRYE